MGNDKDQLNSPFSDETDPNNYEAHFIHDHNDIDKPDHDTPTIPLSMQAQQLSSPLQNDYLSALNNEQHDAVISIDGPLLVLAGAGTGKTKVLTSRIAHILHSGKANPHEILAVTFTNKAAREMKERIGKMLGQRVEGLPWLGTFHSICVKMLRRNPEPVGLKSNFTILDSDDQLRLLKQVLETENIDPKRWSPRHIAGMIDNWKNRALSPKDVPDLDAAIFANGRGAEIYQAYQNRLKSLNAVDFGDLLLESVRLLKEHPDIQAFYRKRFKYILVDEYQDTNVAQYLWLRLLAPSDGNICCVGDDDQSIYGWRGAEVDNILRFEKDFIGARVIRLERNYRSTSHILNAASHLIKNNESRLGKTLRPNAEEGEKLTLCNVWDSTEEARSIGEEIERQQRQDYNLDEIAILVRTSGQMREFEDRFVTMSIPYRVIGGPRFYERMEIRDALAYFRAVLQPSDDLAFERIINTPKRGLGDTTVKTLMQHARRQNIPLMMAASELVQTQELKPRARNSLSGLLENFARWRSLIDSMGHRELAELILEESGYTEMWKQDKSIEAEGRLDNLKELSKSLEGFEDLQGFLEHIALVLDTSSEQVEEKVNIMTLHSAKGLEFDIVYLPGWEEGLFPSQRSLDENGNAGLEEERRLAYVGITRAKKIAKISFTKNRRIHGMWQSAIPSRFIDELPPQSVDIVDGSGANAQFNAFDSHRNSKAIYGSDNDPLTPHFNPSKAFKHSSTKTLDVSAVDITAAGESKFSLGERVFHLKFGYGRITHMDGNKLSIAFEKAGDKKVIASFVESADRQ